MKKPTVAAMKAASQKAAKSAKAPGMVVQVKARPINAADMKKVEKMKAAAKKGAR